MSESRLPIGDDDLIRFALHRTRRDSLRMAEKKLGVSYDTIRRWRNAYGRAGDEDTDTPEPLRPDTRARLEESLRVLEVGDVPGYAEGVEESIRIFEEAIATLRVMAGRHARRRRKDDPPPADPPITEPDGVRAAESSDLSRGTEESAEPSRPNPRRPAASGRGGRRG